MTDYRACLDVGRGVSCHFYVSAVGRDRVAIVDDSFSRGGVSLTNAVEDAVLWCLNHFGSERRIIYRDSSGQWDELVHDGRRFVRFQPLPHQLRIEAEAEL